MSCAYPVPEVGRFSFVLFPQSNVIFDLLSMTDLAGAFASVAATAKQEQNKISVEAMDDESRCFNCVLSNTDQGYQPRQLELIWYGNENDLRWTKNYPPTLGSFDKSKYPSEFIKFLDKWPNDLQCLFSRATFTISLVYPVASPEDATCLLGKILSNVKNIVGGADDFLYQSNFPLTINFHGKDLNGVVNRF